MLRVPYSEVDDVEVIQIPFTGMGRSVRKAKTKDPFHKDVKEGFHPSRGSKAVALAKALRNAWDLSLSFGRDKACRRLARGEDSEGEISFRAPFRRNSPH